MKIPGYEGICRICLRPIEEGKGIKVDGRNYHKECVKKGKKSE